MKTLGDYRKQASGSLKGKNSTAYDAIRGAFEDYTNLLSIVVTDTPGDRWNRRRETETTTGLLLSIRLLEFSVTYMDVNSLHVLLPGWPVQHVDRNLTLIPTKGPQSYGDAVFRCVRELGMDIILALQSARQMHVKGKIYLHPFAFLHNTAEVDKLRIEPTPHRIIKAMFDRVVDGLSKAMQRDGVLASAISDEFGIVCRQFKEEWDRVQKPPVTAPAEPQIRPMTPGWSCPNLKRLRDIDSNPNRKGIPGNKKILKQLKDWLNRRRKRSDIAATLYLEDGQIKTKMPHRSMFQDYAP